MPKADLSKIAIELLQKRSREELIESLDTTMTDMGREDAIRFFADLFLTLGADRDHLKERLAALLAARFGRSSEKSSEEQLNLFAEVLLIIEGTPKKSREEQTSPETSEEKPATASQLIDQTNTEIDEVVAQKRAQKKAAQAARRAQRAQEKAEGVDAQPWPSHLPSREEVLEVEEEHRHCPDCGCERKIIRYETSWRMERTVTIGIVLTKRPVVACASHHGGPITAPVPPKPVDKGQIGFSMAAHILWLRITHNIPVRRIAEMMTTEGAPISESMIHTLIEKSGERLKPVAAAILGMVQVAELVNLDDTPVQVLGGKRKQKRRQARVWLALGDEHFAYFFATKTWKAEEAKKALGKLSGVLQGDGYRGFPKYAEENGMALAGCMAHLRRKFKAALDAKDPRAAEPMALIQGLYRVEKLAKLRELDDDGRLLLRQERSVTIMAELVKWARDVAPTIVTGSPLGKAWTYLSNQLQTLQVFLTDGHVSIDNNAAERGLRRITIGRKLWLFFRGQDKLEHVSRLMSVLYTARLHGVNEKDYLTWLLQEVARRSWSDKAARALLPDVWGAMTQQQAKEIDADG